MIGKKRAIWLLLATALAMSSAAVPVAQATPKFQGAPTTPPPPDHTIIEGTTEEGEVEKFTVGANKVECHGKFTGTSLTGEDSELTMTPEYTYPDTGGNPDCRTHNEVGDFTTHVSMNGCDYLLHSGTKLKEGEYTGTVDVKCPEGKKIEVKVTNASGGTKCKLEIGAQNGLNHVIYKNKEVFPRDVTAEVTLEGIKYTQVEGGILGCGQANGEHSDGKYTSKVTLKGFGTEGEPADLEMDGVFQGAPTTPPPPDHTIIEGTTEEGEVEKFTVGANKVECHGKFTGTSLTGEDSELTMTPEYTYPDTGGNPDCRTHNEVGDFTTHVSMNGCDYLLHSGTKLKEGEYTGTVDVKCPEGKKIEVKVTNASGGTKCKLEIGAQNGLNHVIYKNKEVFPRDVTAEVTLEGIKYTQVEGGILGCGQANGEHSDGKYTSKVTLKGFGTEGEPADLEMDGVFQGAPTTPPPPDHTIIEGTTEEGEVEKFTVGANKVECHGKFTGTSLTGEDSELTMTPEYTYPDTGGGTDCRTTQTGIGVFTTDMSPNGCDYVLHSGTKIGAGEYTGTVDVKCPEGKKIEVKVTNASGGTKCKLEIGAQNGLNHVIYKNKEVFPRDVTAEVTLEGIKYTQVEGGFLGCGQTNGTYSNGTYASKVTLKGFGTEGERADLEVDGE